MLGVSLSWASKTRLKYAFRRKKMVLLGDADDMWPFGLSV